jgi:hypothetical protein
MLSALLLALSSAAALLPAALGQVPPLGPLSDGLRPLSRPSFSLRHCSFVASFCPTEDSNADFSFSLVAGVSGAAGTYSFESAGYPGMYLGLKNASSGALGLIQPPTDGTTAAAGTLGPCHRHNADCGARIWRDVMARAVPRSGKRSQHRGRNQLAAPG